MTKFKLIIPCVCTVLAMVAVSQAKGWRGLVPLHSTRTDVERLLGAPKESAELRLRMRQRMNGFLSFTLRANAKKANQMIGMFLVTPC